MIKGHIVREIREKRKMTITELGKRIGVSRSQMSRLEDGTRTLTADTLEKIANVLEEPIETFYPEAAVKRTEIEGKEVVTINLDKQNLKEYSDEEILRYIRLGREKLEQKGE